MANDWKLTTVENLVIGLVVADPRDPIGTSWLKPDIYESLESELIC